jgi:hypothetical protein
MVGKLQDFEMAVVKIDLGTRRVVMLLHMVEEPEFHERPTSHVCGRFP